MRQEEVLEINDDQTVRLVTRQVSGVPRYHVQATDPDDGYWYGTDPPLYTPMFTDEQEARDAYVKRCDLRRSL